MTIGTDTLAQDSFNRANGDLNGSTMSDTVNTWTTVSGTCSVASNKQTGAGVARLTSNAGIGNANYSVQAEQYMKGDVSVASDGVDGTLTLFARYVDSNNFYYATIQCAASAYDALYYNIGKVVSGSHTSLVDGQEDDTGGTTWRLDADGTSLKLFKDGSQVLSTTDSAITGTGYPALSSGSRTGVGGAPFSNDNFIVKGTAAGSGGAIDGSVPIAITPSGTLKGTGSLDGTAAITLSGSGTLGVVETGGPIDGEIQLSIAGAGILAGVGSLDGNVPMAMSLSGTMSSQGSMQGTIQMSFSASATAVQNTSLSNPQATPLHNGWTGHTIDVNVP